MRLLLLVGALLLAGCSSLNLYKSQDDYCLWMKEMLPGHMDTAIKSEASKGSPNGALSQPYSREAWDEYWNDRIFYVWDVGPEDCGGMYQGPTGPKLIRDALEKRQKAGLPEVNLEPRNLDKDI